MAAPLLKTTVRLPKEDTLWLAEGCLGTHLKARCRSCLLPAVSLIKALRQPLHLLTSIPPPCPLERVPLMCGFARVQREQRFPEGYTAPGGKEHRRKGVLTKVGDCLLCTPQDPFSGRAFRQHIQEPVQSIGLQFHTQSSSLVGFSVCCFKKKVNVLDVFLRNVGLLGIINFT